MNTQSQAAIHQPSVAVIIPTHNRWPLICEAIDSVLTQTYVNTQCIVIDDASTDNTVVELAGRYQNRITLLTNGINREKSFSRNRGVRETTADYVCFLDSDDLLTPNSIARRMQVFLKNPGFEGVAFGHTARTKTNISAESVDFATPSNDAQNDRTVGTKKIPHTFGGSLDLGHYLADKNILHTSGILISRNLMLAHGMFSEMLTNREDIELFIRLLTHSEFRACGTTVSILRTHSNNRARTNWDKIIQQGLAMSDILAKNLGTGDGFDEILSIVKAEEYSELLRALYRKKDYADYLKLFDRARSEKLIPLTMQNIKRNLLARFISGFRRIHK